MQRLTNLHPLPAARPFTALVSWLGPLSLLLLTACQSGSSPTEPQLAVQERIVISTELGTLDVIPYDCGSQLDLNRIQAELATTANVAQRQNPELAVFDRRVLDGFEIHSRSAQATQEYCGPTALACFKVRGGVGQLHVWCDAGGVEHEAAHAIAYGAGLPCYRDVYHGMNFECQAG